ncbi:hypothetical protein [Neobacillus sp. YIM B06451]|uniref:hypothetical protein n=1 Tax=Neobacillus sp. YIM B06451 TaxID=3070994 RepID=UPI002931ED82|nr:hypothetical protein [Neobacillus sp. YIM B06451]
MKRKLTIAVVCGFVIIAAGLLFILDRAKYTNYKEAVSDMLSDGEQVNKIEILWTIRDDNQGYIQKTATITNENTIRRILEEPSNMKLKKHDRTPGVEYMLTFYSDSKTHYIYFGEGDMEIGNSFFKVADENLLEKVIKNEDLEWITKK